MADKEVLHNAHTDSFCRGAAVEGTVVASGQTCAFQRNNPLYRVLSFGWETTTTPTPEELRSSNIVDHCPGPTVRK